MNLSSSLALGSAAVMAGGYVITDADAAAHVARLSTPISATRKRAIDNLIIDLKAGGVYSKLDCMWDLCAASEADALRNIKSASFSLAKTGTVAFTPNIGAAGDGSTGYLSTQFTPSTAGGQYAQNSATVGAFVNNPDTATNKFVVGTNNSTFGPRLRPAQVTTGTYGVSGYINNATAFAGTRKAKPTPVLASIGRTGALIASVYENGVKTGEDIANISTGIPTQAIWLMRNGTNYSSETLAFAYIGGGLTDAENEALWEAIRAYLVAVQRPIGAEGDSLTEGLKETGVYSANPWPKLLQSALGRMVYNAGVAGQTSTQIKDRQIAETYTNYGTQIIWAGRNNYTSPTTVKADIASMVAHSASGRYIVLSILNGDYATEYAGQADYATIVALNADLATLYGPKYYDIRADLVALGGPGQAYADPTNFARDVYPDALRDDQIHPNDTCIPLIAVMIQNKLASLGY